MNNQYIECNTDKDGVCRIALNRPEKRNALDREFIKSLTSFFRTNDVNIRVVILSGNGASFCAGADLEYMRSMKDYNQEENIADSLELSALFYAIYQYPRPVIANVHGHVYGGGIGLAAASDFVLAQPSTKFCFSEVRLGLVPAVISPFCINRMGSSKANHLFLTGEVFDETIAKDLGLVDYVISQDNHDIEERTIKNLLKGAPLAQERIKKIIREHTQISSENHIRINSLATHIAEARNSDSGQEGINSFFDKRKANWPI